MDEATEKEIQLRVEARIAELAKDPKIVIAAYQKQVAALGMQIEQLEDQAEKDAPLVEFATAVMKSDETIEMSAVAKTLNIPGWGRNNIFALLRDRGVLRHNNEPYQRYVDQGYFRVIEQSWVNEYTGSTNIVFKTVVFQKGIDYIRKLIVEFGE